LVSVFFLSPAAFFLSVPRRLAARSLFFFFLSAQILGPPPLCMLHLSLCYGVPLFCQPFTPFCFSISPPLSRLVSLFGTVPFRRLHGLVFFLIAAGLSFLPFVAPCPGGDIFDWRPGHLLRFLVPPPLRRAAKFPGTNSFRLWSTDFPTPRFSRRSFFRFAAPHFLRTYLRQAFYFPSLATAEVLFFTCSFFRPRFCDPLRFFVIWSFALCLFSPAGFF